MSMVKSELVQRIVGQRSRLYGRDVAKVVDAILEEIVAALARGDRVELCGFGVFSRPGQTRRFATHQSVQYFTGR
jgi:integration host factor subunit beta